jgi:hypothetical protein
MGNGQVKYRDHRLNCMVMVRYGPVMIWEWYRNGKV